MGCSAPRVLRRRSRTRHPPVDTERATDCGLPWGAAHVAPRTLAPRWYAGSRDPGRMSLALHRVDQGVALRLGQHESFELSLGQMTTPHIEPKYNTHAMGCRTGQGSALGLSPVAAGIRFVGRRPTFPVVSAFGSWRRPTMPSSLGGSDGAAALESGEMYRCCSRSGVIVTHDMRTYQQLISLATN